MTLPLWGQLEKAQDDSQTIVAAIAAAIAAHEADPEAHLGEGESLELHKAEDVIDHPPGSILPDKISFSDLSFDTTFEATTGFTEVGNVSNSSWPGVVMEAEDGGTEISSLRANMAGLLNVGNLTHSLLFDTYFYFEAVGTTPIFQVGVVNNGMDDFRLGFSITGGEIKGFGYWGGSLHYTSALYTPDVDEVVFVRVYFDYGANVIYFYVNGVMVGSLQPSGAMSLSNQFGFKVDANGDEAVVWRIFRFTLSRNI